MSFLFRAVCLWLLLGLGAVAQTPAGDQTRMETPSGEIDYAQWETTATRAEDVVAAARASSDALETLRQDIVDWRALFLAAQETNGTRIETVRGQIAALGDLQEGETEPLELKARRDALTAQLAELRAPVLRAEEAFSRANGLVAEIDAIIRARQTQNLLELGPSPLNPVNWPAGWKLLLVWVEEASTDTFAIMASEARKAEALSRLPAIGTLTLIGLVLLVWARRWVSALGRAASAHVATRWGWLLGTFVSLAHILLPILGGSMLLSAMTLSGVLTRTTEQFANALLILLVAIVVAGWIANTLFPPSVDLARPFLSLPAHLKPKARGLMWGMGLSFGLYVVVNVIAEDPVATPQGAVVILYPVLFLAAWFLFRFGRLLTRTVRPEEGVDMPYRDRVFAMGGRVIMVLAILGAAAGGIGYFVAAEATIGPLIGTVTVFAVVLILNRIAGDIFVAISAKDGDGDADSLVPVLIGLLLVLSALPVLALIWGARVADLTELWTTFLEGVSVGGTRISPSNFLTFILVFVIGYTGTRVLQGTLRNSVLPKTKLDVGGQTAIVSGLGYVGIFLAAVIAITTAGIDLSSLAIVAGALSVGIGFGLQNVVSNFVSGIILLIERPVSEGDWIEVGGVMGTVRRISVRATRIETFDRTDVIVPNADLISSHVTNWTKTNLTGRLIVPVGVAYGTNTRKVEAILQEIAEAQPMVILNPPPAIIFAGLGADSLNFEIRVILRNVNFIMSVKTDILHAVVERFAAEGIEIPFAQRDVWLRNPEALKGGTVPKESPYEPEAVS